MDFVMVHTYSRHNKTDMADNSQYYTVATSRQFHKPTYVAETGETVPDHHHSFPTDPSGIGLHNALWASMTSMGAMTSMVWWWDSWVAPHNLYHHFTAVRTFADSIDWAKHTWTPIGRNATQQCTDINPDHRVPPEYTCAQQASWGKCDGKPNGTNPWMKGMCCKTCHPHSLAACRQCSAERHGDNGGGHQAVALGAGARAFGMVGQPLGGVDGDAGVVTVVMWVQNRNYTFSQQDATKPAASRPPLLTIRNLYIDFNTIPMSSRMLGLVGHFNVTFINTTSGAAMGEVQSLQCPKDCRAIVPAFTTDIAVAVKLA